jgi:hypothetical protein
MGYIEKVRTNLLLQSEAFNTTWSTYTGTTVTANAVSAPNGTLTADRIEGTSAAARGVYQSISTSAIPHTFSVYLKSATGSSTTCRIWVDSFASIITVTNDWQRFSVTGITAAGFGQFTITSAASSAIDVYAWGAQVETGDIATDYIPTTTVAVSVGPVANLPRLNYPINSDGSVGCPSLLLEPQRTNLALYSEQFDNAYWTKFNATITENNAVSPDGTSSADRLVLTSVSAASQTMSRQAAIVTSTTTVTFSTFVKYVDKQYIQLVFAGSFSSQFANFDLINGTVTAGTYVGANVQNYGNGWYRISITTTGLNTNCLPFIWALDTALAGRAADSTSTGTSAYLLWGAQVEDGSYATSYIPTLGAAVTRLADSCSKTGISSLIGQTEGTLFVEATDLFASGTRTIALLYTSGSAFYQVYINASNQVRVDVNGSFLFLGGSIAANTN